MPSFFILGYEYIRESLIMQISPINSFVNSTRNLSPKFAANENEDSSSLHDKLVDVAEGSFFLWLMTDQDRFELKDFIKKEEKWYQKIPKLLFTVALASLVIDICVRLYNTFVKNSQ